MYQRSKGDTIHERLISACITPPLAKSGLGQDDKGFVKTITPNMHSLGVDLRRGQDRNGEQHVNYATTYRLVF